MQVDEFRNDISPCEILGYYDIKQKNIGLYSQFPVVEHSPQITTFVVDFKTNGKYSEKSTSRP